MANKLGIFLGKKLGSGTPVNNATILNMVREFGSDAYKSAIPIIDTMRPINHITVPTDSYIANQNEFFNILVNKIGPTFLKALLFENPLGVFRKETFSYGDTLEEIYTGLADQKIFNAKDNTSPFAFADTMIQVFYHQLNDERYYERTIEKAWTEKAFKNDRSFDEFIDKMFVSFISSDELDEYEKIKRLVTTSLTPVTIGGGPNTIATPSTPIDTTLNDWVLTLNKAIITRSNLFGVPSRTRFENAAKVPQATALEDQFLIVSTDVSTELDSLYANAFNMDKATPLSKKIIIDEFPQYTGPGPVNNGTPIAALISRDTIILMDKLLQMENIYNPRTMSFNYFLHHHQLISYSLLENAHIFYTPA